MKLLKKLKQAIQNRRRIDLDQVRLIHGGLSDDDM